VFPIRKGFQNCSLLVDLVQLSADQPLSNFLGAAADVVKLGISPEPSAGVLVDVAIATEELDALICVGDSYSRCLEVDTRGVHVGLDPFIECSRNLVDHASRRLEIGVHISKLCLNELKLVQR
jgi:hypothetical protein